MNKDNPVPSIVISRDLFEELVDFVEFHCGSSYSDTTKEDENFLHRLQKIKNGVETDKEQPYMKKCDCRYGECVKARNHYRICTRLNVKIDPDYLRG